MPKLTFSDQRVFQHPEGWPSDRIVLNALSLEELLALNERINDLARAAVALRETATVAGFPDNEVRVWVGGEACAVGVQGTKEAPYEGLMAEVIPMPRRMDRPFVADPAPGHESPEHEH